MEISVLVENDMIATDRPIQAAHGFSLLIRFQSKNILVDVADKTLFHRNAEALGIDIADVDILVISHAHIDHGGGLGHFLQVNSKAAIYMHAAARYQYYTKVLGLIPYPIGLNQNVLNQAAERIRFIDEDTQIDESTFLVTGFTEKFPRATSNRALWTRRNGKLIRDTFDHELALIIKEPDGNVIVSSCSHSGIDNIVNGARGRHQEDVKAVFGGFHLYNPMNGRRESEDYVRSVAENLLPGGTKFYTGHCTGEKNINIMKSILGDRIRGIHTGDGLTV